MTQAVYSSPLVIIRPRSIAALEAVCFKNPLSSTPQNQELLKDGYVVQLISKVGGKCLRVLERGQVDCLGEAGTSCELRDTV